MSSEPDRLQLALNWSHAHASTQTRINTRACVFKYEAIFRRHAQLFCRAKKAFRSGLPLRTSSTGTITLGSGKPAAMMRISANFLQAEVTIAQG
jgi:hypothetical protein